MLQVKASFKKQEKEKQKTQTRQMLKCNVLLYTLQSTARSTSQHRLHETKAG